MSSSQAQPFSPPENDHPMMDPSFAPDSPPEMTANNPFSSPQSSFSQPVGTSQSTPQRANGDTKVNHGAPGSSWNTKKFSEEFERAHGQLLDANWDHTKYGDVLK